MDENSVYVIKYLNTNYQTAVFNLHHCLDELFFRYLLLSKDEFSESNNKHAAYDYVKDIIEHICFD